MLAVNTEVHLRLKVQAPGANFNDLAAQGRRLGAVVTGAVLARVLWTMQEAELDGVRDGARELACPGCGVVHCGGRTLLRRGRRPRIVQTSSGPVCFALRQVSCGACRKTFAPFGGALGLRPRQRVAEELLEQLGRGVLDLSYRKTCRLGGQWLGGTVGPRTLWRDVQARGRRVQFTHPAPLGTLLVDGTRVPAGPRARGEAAVLALQIEGRERRGNRSPVRKRVIGFAVGRDAWPRVLAAGRDAPLVVTDAASGLRELVRAVCPGARHQLCEWHLPYSLQHFLMLEGVPRDRRRALAGELGAILQRSPRRARPAYRRFLRKVRRYRSARTLLRQALPHILARRAGERTTSLAEREMRELNRRTDIGVCWSVDGVRNLLSLRLAQRHNPDDYAKLWLPKRAVHWCLTA
jgi:hypothetical protein